MWATIRSGESSMSATSASPGFFKFQTGSQANLCVENDPGDWLTRRTVHRHLFVPEVRISIGPPEPAG